MKANLVRFVGVCILAVANVAAFTPPDPAPIQPEPVRIVSQPADSGVSTGGFFAALTPEAQAVALENPVQIAAGQLAARFADMGYGGACVGGIPYVAPNYQWPGMAAHEEAHILHAELSGAPPLTPLARRYIADPTFAADFAWTDGRVGELFASIMSHLWNNPGAIAGRNPADGFREVFEPFVNAAYLWPYRPGPRITGGY